MGVGCAMLPGAGARPEGCSTARITMRPENNCPSFSGGVDSTQMRQILFILPIAIAASYAESANEIELKQVLEQRDKAIAAAVEPINRRTRESLEKLLRKATQANDLDAAVKIQKAIKDLAPPPVSNNALKRIMTGGSWSWWTKADFEGTPEVQIQFLDGGKCKAVPWEGSLSWDILSPNQLKVAVDKERYWVFDMDMEAKEGRTNLNLSTLKQAKAIRQNPQQK
jgi:hypothetical protein